MDRRFARLLPGIRVLLGGIQKAGTIDDIPAIVEGVRQTSVVQELLPGNPVITWGGTETWGQPHQMQVPVVLNTIRDGERSPSPWCRRRCPEPTPERAGRYGGG